MTRVAILWHMHQPFYQDLATGEHILPWARLHALKDYYGMVALLREFPGVRMTFNLVPSLLVQLDAFAVDQARDRHLAIGLKPADSLSDEERAFCVEQFFHAPRAQMIDPYPRYAELLARRDNGGLSAGSAASAFSNDDLRDLQVWHKLAWVDPFYLDDDARVRALVGKGRGFSEDDKATLRAVELEILRKVIPEYRDAAGRGQVELSTSPFYHPILPLLCDTDVYLRTHPQARMPRERFRRPDDAAEQISRAITLHERMFGQRPAGMWPSEGSVSDDMVPLVAAAGLRWIATDEAILARTLNIALTRDGQGTLEQPDVLYRPYTVGTGPAPVGILFRDHTLSDLIGFSYSSWSADFAADDFVRRLLEAGDRYAARTNQEATIAVILDGENAWEHYVGGGRPFLRALYSRLEGHPMLRTVTAGEACADAGPRLPQIFPGSWINGDFSIWIGHEDDRRAWDQLSEARRAFDKASGAHQVARDRAYEELLIAEGSDWCWWYGDDHSSEHDVAFDELFRHHLRNAYRALDAPIPEDLFVSNISTETALAAVTPPVAQIHPIIDGETTSYFEWLGAGCVEIAQTSGAMHQVSAPAQTAGLTLVEFGVDATHLYVRLEADAPMEAVLKGGATAGLTFLRPAGIELSVSDGDGGLAVDLSDRRESQPATGCPGAHGAASRVLELQLPFACLGATAADTLAFIVWLRRGEQEVEHHPRRRPIEVQVP